MRIITVIPIKRGIGKDTLSYFTTKDIPLGSVVSISVRKKNAHGLVIETREVSDIKSELKSLSYSIKKIENIKARQIISNEFTEATKQIADWNAASVGSVMSALIPKAILEESEIISYIPKEKPKGIFHETLLLQSETEERYATYRSLIREEFAKNRSVFFCLPTTEDILNAKSILEKGIEKYTFVIHASLPRKEIISRSKEVIENDHPVLIIATGTFISLPKDDLGTIILDKESSRGYKMQTRPYIDIRAALQIFAKKSNVRLVMGDTLLRSETLWEEKQGKYAELAPLKWRSLSPANSEILSMRIPKDMKKKEFSIFDSKVLEMIRKTKENNEHTFLFCARKGLYPTTVCSDCGTTVVCKNCNAPVVLYGRPPQTKGGVSGNLFVCHHCGERRDANELCIYCKSWRLSPLGIGVDRIVSELHSLFPEMKIIVMDKEHVKNHKEAVKTRDTFYSSPGSIMVGTEMAMTYLSQKIENSAIVSIDSYFAIPDYEMNEKVFHILLGMRAISEKNFFIQTRQDNQSFNWKVFDYALRGNLIDFYRDEIEDRKAMDYPPFSKYIKLSLTGDKLTVKKQMEKIKEFLIPFEIMIFEAWNPHKKGKFTLHGLIKIEIEKWIDTELLSKLRSLPPQVSVRVEPQSLL